MSITYIWNFLTFETLPNDGELSDVVTSIKYMLSGHDNEHIFSHTGTVALHPPDSENFIAFKDITKDWAISAVEAATDIASIKSMIDTQIGAMKNPSPVTVLPPF